MKHVLRSCDIPPVSDLCGQQLESHDQNGARLKFRNLTNALIVLHTQYQVKNICNPNII